MVAVGVEGEQATYQERLRAWARLATSAPSPRAASPVARPLRNYPPTQADRSRALPGVVANNRQLHAIITQMRQVATKATGLTMTGAKNRSGKVQTQARASRADRVTEKSRG